MHEYINVLTPKTFREQRALLKQKRLITPQDYMSVMVWNFKMYGVFVDGVPISENQFKQHGEVAESGDKGEQDKTAP